MARKKAEPADEEAALLDSVSTRPAHRRGRRKGLKNKPKPAAQLSPRRLRRPKGSKNKPKVAASTAAAPKTIRRRRRRLAKVVELTLGQRVESMIAELTGLRGEIVQLERLRDALKSFGA